MIKIYAYLTFQESYCQVFFQSASNFFLRQNNLHTVKILIKHLSVKILMVAIKILIRLWARVKFWTN